MEKENLMTKKTLDLNPIKPNSKDKTKIKDEINDNINGKKSTTNKNPRSKEKKIIDDEEINNDSHMKDITVMMKKILDDI
jgi:hypothetical protein